MTKKIASVSQVISRYTRTLAKLEKELYQTLTEYEGALRKKQIVHIHSRIKHAAKSKHN